MTATSSAPPAARTAELRPDATIQKKTAAEDAALRRYLHALTRGAGLPGKRAIISVLKARALGSAECLHSHVVKAGLAADRFAAAALVGAYAADGRLDSGRSVFRRVSPKDATSYTTMLTACAENGDILEARELFDEMPEKDTIAWNAMLSGYARCGLAADALELLREMQARGLRPNEVTLVSALSACAQLACAAAGEWIHAYADRAPDVAVTPTLSNALVNMYAKCGRPGAAYGVFAAMGPEKNVASWNTMLGCFAAHGCGTAALSLFSQMVKTAVAPDRISFLGLLGACAHAGMVGHALSCFDCMRRVFGVGAAPEHYGCLVDVLSRRGYLPEARALVRARTTALEGDASAWGALSAGCRRHGDLALGLEAAGVLVEIDPGEEGRYLALCSVYAMGGRGEDSMKARQGMKELRGRRSSGSSVIEVGGVVHEFVAADRSHPGAEEIYATLESLRSNLVG